MLKDWLGLDAKEEGGEEVEEEEETWRAGYTSTSPHPPSPTLQACKPMPPYTEPFPVPGDDGCCLSLSAAIRNSVLHILDPHFPRKILHPDLPVRCHKGGRNRVSRGTIMRTTELILARKTTTTAAAWLEKRQAWHWLEYMPGRPGRRKRRRGRRR